MRPYFALNRRRSGDFTRRASMILVAALVGFLGPALAAFDAEARQRRPKRQTVNPVPKAYMMQHRHGYWAPRNAPYVHNPNTEAAMRIQDSHNGSVGP